MAHFRRVTAIDNSIDFVVGSSANATVSSFTEATPSDSGGNESVVATTQHKSNYSYKASATASHCYSVTKLSRLDPKPVSTTVVTEVVKTKTKTVATLFEAFLAIIIALAPVVTGIITTTSFQAQVEDTSLSTRVTNIAANTLVVATRTTTQTAPIVEAVAKPEVSSIESSSSDRALNWPVAFITQTGGSLASSILVPPDSILPAPDSVYPLTGAVSAETGAKFKIESLCARAEPKGEEIVGDDCVNDASDVDSDAGADTNEDERVEVREEERVDKRIAERVSVENVSMRIEEKLYKSPFFHTSHSSFESEIRAISNLLWPDEDVESFREESKLVATTINKFSVKAEEEEVKLLERNSSKLLKQVTKDLTRKVEYNKKLLKEKEASSELLRLLIGCYVCLREIRTQEVGGEDRCKGEKESGNYHLRPQTPAILKALLFSIIRVSDCCSSSKFQRVQRNEGESRITPAETTINRIIEGDDISRVSLETNRSQRESENVESLKIRSGEKKFKHSLETHSTDKVVLIQHYNKNGLSITETTKEAATNKITNIQENKQTSHNVTSEPNIRTRRYAKLNQPDLPASIVDKEIKASLLSDQFRVQQQQQSFSTTTTTLLSASTSNSVRINPFNQADRDRMNEDLVELLALFYAHTQELQDKLEHLLYLSKYQRQEFERVFGSELIKSEEDRDKIKQQSTQVVLNEGRNNNKKNSSQSNEHEYESNLIDRQNRKLTKIIKMKIGADEDSLLRWLRQKQEKFSSLKNATFELLNEPPNKTINVCQDGPKILVLPNVSDIFYCYTSEQWVDKLWSDLRLSAFHYPIIVLNILIFLFGTTGNIFVCLSVYRNHQLRNVTNYFIVNLAFADFLVILICLPATVVWDLSLTWFFGTIPCKLIMFLQDVSISVSVLTLTAISIDRYYAVCYPLKFKTSLNQAKRIIVLIWIVSLILMAPDLVYLNAKYSQELSEAGLDTVLYSDCNYDWSEHSSRIFQFVKTILLYLLPFILMLCAHYKIMLTLQAASQSAHNQLVATMKDDEIEYHELETANEEKRFVARSEGGKGDNLEGNGDPGGGEGIEQKVATKGDSDRDDAQLQSISTLPPTPLLKQIRFYQTEGSDIDLYHAENNRIGQQSNNSRYNIKVEANSKRDSSSGRIQNFLSKLTCPNGPSRSIPITPGTSSFTTNANKARGSINSYQINMSSDEVVPTNNTNIDDSGRNSCKRQQSHKASTTGTGTTNNQSSQLLVTMHNKNKLDSRKAAAKMLMTIVVMFGICYLPVHLINFLRQFIDNIPQTDVTSTVSMLSHCACYLNSAINPIIYNHMNSIFRAEFKKFLSCLYCRKKTRTKKINKMAAHDNIDSFKPGIHEPSGMKLKQLNASNQRKLPGVVHQIAISDSEETHLNARAINQVAVNGESTRMTDIF